MYKSIALPYGYSELEPYIDGETMYIHYNTHFLGYLKKLNDEMQKNNYKLIPIRDLIIKIDNYSFNVRNNAGGYFNHMLFWNMLRPNINQSQNIPPFSIIKFIKRDFGNYYNFKNIIIETAKKRFGSGWVWWIMMPNGKTAIVETPYQDNPLMYVDCKILLGIDVWEHAYYLKYQANRENYVNNIFNIINWDYADNIIKKNKIN